MNKPTLRNNQDGTCNCRPLSNGCFFQELDGSRCRCKCHTKPTFETTQCTFESDKWKEKCEELYCSPYTCYSDWIDFISNLLAEQKKDILQNLEKNDISEKHISSHTNQLIEEKGKINTVAVVQNIRTAQYEQDAVEYLDRVLSQTEQECDKKWRTLIESKRKEGDDFQCYDVNCFGQRTPTVIEKRLSSKDEAYNQCLDDLLNNK